MASIIIKTGLQKSEYLPLGRRVSVIGRSEVLPLQILDELASRRHLRVCFNSSTGKYYAEDMKSKHGVFINNLRIFDQTVLRDGDEILIGNTILLFVQTDYCDGVNALEHYKQTGERSHPTRVG